MKQVRSIVAAALLASTAVITLHYLPLMTDSFSVIPTAGTYVKVFKQGWPLPYVAVGELREPGFVVLLKMAADLAFFFLLSFLIVRSAARLRKHSKNR